MMTRVLAFLAMLDKLFLLWCFGHALLSRGFLVAEMLCCGMLSPFGTLEVSPERDARVTGGPAGRLTGGTGCG